MFTEITPTYVMKDLGYYRRISIILQVWQTLAMQYDQNDILYLNMHTHTHTQHTHIRIIKILKFKKEVGIDYIYKKETSQTS